MRFSHLHIRFCLVSPFLLFIVDVTAEPQAFHVLCCSCGNQLTFHLIDLLVQMKVSHSTGLSNMVTAHTHFKHHPTA